MDPPRTATVAPEPVLAQAENSAASGPGLRAVWPRSAQISVAAFLVAALFFVAGRSFFQSLTAGPSAVPSHRIDLNSASRAELLLLPGVGEQLADRIIQTRLQQGPFQTIDDLRKVPGIGPATLERVRAWLFIATQHTPEEAKPTLPLTVEPASKTGKSKKAAGLTELIDINSAGADELMLLPGIGPKLSQRIVEERAKKPFKSVAELRRVYGIGPKTLEKVRPYVVAGP